MSFASKIEISEVCPRDGWQNHKEFIPTETKIALIKKMIDCGPKFIEVTSFVNPKAMPQMADAVQVVEGVADYAASKGTEIMALTLNKRGVDNAKACGVKNVEFVVSVSEEHNRRNSNRSIAESWEDFKRLVGETQGLNIRLALPCVFGSPFGDEISLDLVLKLCEEAEGMGVTNYGLADTAGISTPAHTRKVLQYLLKTLDKNKVSIHLHDTRGMGLANAWVALEEGIQQFDSALGAMGGCPFVPGAKGNIATEDLVNMAAQSGLQTGYNLDKLLDLAVEMSGLIHADLASSMGRLALAQKAKNEAC